MKCKRLILSSWIWLLWFAFESGFIQNQAFASQALSCGNSCQVLYKSEDGSSRLLNQIFLGRGGGKEFWLFIKPGAPGGGYDYRVTAFDTSIIDYFDALLSKGWSCFESLEGFKNSNPWGYQDFQSLNAKSCSASGAFNLDWYKDCQFNSGTIAAIFGETPKCYYSTDQRPETPQLSDQTRLSIWKSIKANSPKLLYCYQSTCRDNPNSFDFSFGSWQQEIHDGLLFKGNFRGINIYLDDKSLF